VDKSAANATTLQGLLGYLNFSTGRPDPRIQAQFFAAWATVAGWPSPRLAMVDKLSKGLAELHAKGQAGFTDVQQAEAVIDIALRHVPSAYRRHHEDLLNHQNDLDIFQAGFLIRCVETVLSHQGPWEEVDRIVAGSLKQLNDYVGHRPIAVLETRPRGEPYDHEKLRPVPIYVRGAGVVPGKYAALVTAALDLLKTTPANLMEDAYFNFDHLDELAFDPRAYDHQHPADRRPNYRFGEWDPHHIDNRGFFRRFVVRQGILDGLLNRAEKAKEFPPEELMREAAVVLAATVLMASGISGAGPDTHDSSVNLAMLMPKIATYRDEFYRTQLAAVTGGQGQRLQQEAKVTRQPFGGARQHINQYLAEQRAAQLQQRRLALLLAELGYPAAARAHAARVPTASMRMLSEIHIQLTTSHIMSERGKLVEAANHLDNAEDVLHRAIACGAMADPWNILGFQALFPLFTAMEDSVRDTRIDELVNVVARLLAQYAHLRGEAAAAGDGALSIRLATRMEKLAVWWDAFATTAVSEVRHVVGSEAAAAAEHVAEALGKWRERGEAAADLTFWRQHLDRFRTAKSFGLVIEELLGKRDYKAAMALLVNWLSQAESVPLEDGEHSFHNLALRWMLGLTQEKDPAPNIELMRRFIDHLEANAEDYWQVPKLERTEGAEQLPMPREVEEDDEPLFGAAYEGMTFQDSADDGVEGELLGFETQQEFELEREAEKLEQRLRFLSTVARLFHVGGRALGKGEVVEQWLSQARRNYADLLALMDAIHQWPVPAPSGSYDSLVEFDRRQQAKQRLLHGVIGSCLEWALAVGSMMSVTGTIEDEAAEAKRPRWEPALLQLEQALWHGDADTARKVLPKFLEHFQHEPLLFIPVIHGGNPRLILRASIAQTLLRALVANLPRLGLLRETYAVLRVAQTMEREQKLQGPRVTEFDRLYQIACQASIEAAVASISADKSLPEQESVHLLGRLIEPFLALWAEHCQTVRLSILEALAPEAAWKGVRNFIRKYGHDLFHARFMTLGNLRGILQRGVGAYLEYLGANPDPQNPVSLIDALDRGIKRADAEQWMQIILQAVVENYEEYKDYNTTTPQSDYGENLYTLLDFLRVKAGYGRQAWLLRPLWMVHEVLVKHTSEGAAAWQQQVERLTHAEADKYVAHLAELEKQHGMRLRTVSDRVRERFVQPLALDRVCAKIEPAYEQARAGGTTQALEALEQGLKPYLETPSGAGLDVPPWLARLEAELHRVEAKRTAMANLTENLVQVPSRLMSVESLRQQLADWPKP